MKKTVIRLLLCGLPVFAGEVAWGATYTMAPASRPTCSSGGWSVSGSTYTCNGSFSLASGDSLLPGASITVVANAGITLLGNTTVGSPSVSVSLQTTYGDLVASGSNNVIYGNLVAASGAINLTNTSVTGSITTNGTVTLSGGSVTGNVSGRNGVTTSSGTTIGGTVTATNGSISLSGGSVAGLVSSNCCTVTTNNTNLSGGVNSSSSTVTINGGTIAGPMSSSGGSGINISNATMTSGSITTTSVPISISNSTIGSSSAQVSVVGNNTVTISGSTSVYGNVTAGSWNTALNIDSDSFIYGVCSSNSNSVASPTQYPRCLGAAPMAEWRMDETSWIGANGEVKDSSGNGYHGTAAYANGSGPAATTASTNKAYTSGTQSTCNYGQFDSTSSPVRTYTQVSLPAKPALPSAFTFTAWIRSSNVSSPNQRILVNDDDQNGWGFSLGDGASGSLRLFNRNISNSGSVTGSGSNPSCGVFCLDTNAVISNNAWYFAAAAVDTAAKTVTLYVFNQSGSLQAQTSTSFSGNWANGSGIWAIGGETSASSEGTQSAFHFKGNIDEVAVYSAALSQTALQPILTRVRTCPSTAVNHYELRLPASSLACVSNQVTIAACSDNAYPCSNYVSTIGGQTAVLSTSGGATLGATTVTFNASGLASTSLSFPAAANNTPVTVGLSGETIAAQTARACCVGSSCTVANSCATTFNTAGFIFSDVANGTNITLPSQIAGVSSSQILRAVQTNTTTKACEAALIGTKSVDFAYECDANPSTCNTSVGMSVTGSGAAQSIGRNNNDSVTSFQSVSLNFDANGNAPFSFVYGDVGQVRLWARKAAGGDSPALLTALTATSNAFAVKPYDFGIDTVSCSSGVGNPAAVDATGAKFCAAGDPFSLRVSARALGGVTTPSFGRCDGSGSIGCAAANETVTLTHTLVAPTASAPSTGALGGTTTMSASAFVADNGRYAFNNVNWSEVGIINLKAANGNYLGNALSMCSIAQTPGEACRGTFGSSGNVGRFFPKYFQLAITPQTGCPAFVYGGHVVAGGGVLRGQPFTVTATAMNGLTPAATTVNYRYSATATDNFAKDVDLTLVQGGGVGALYVESSPGGTNEIPAAKFAAGVGVVNLSDTSGKISYVFNGTVPNLTTPPTPLTLHADNVDSTPSAATGNASTAARLGRLSLSNAFGAQLLPLDMVVQTQYWTGRSWALNDLDSCTQFRSSDVFLSNALTVVSPVTPVVTPPGPLAFKIAAGRGAMRLAAPVAGNGSVDVAANLGPAGNDLSCLGTHGGTSGDLPLPWLRSRYGNNANCPGGTYDRDPSARATFGIFSPESQRLIHVREW